MPVCARTFTPLHNPPCLLPSSPPPRPSLLLRLQFTATQKMSSSGCPHSCTPSHSYWWSVTRNTPTILAIKLLTGLLLMQRWTSMSRVKDITCLAFNLNTHGHSLWKWSLYQSRCKYYEQGQDMALFTFCSVNTNNSYTHIFASLFIHFAISNN